MGYKSALTSNEIESLFKTGTVILFKCKATKEFPLTFVSGNCHDILGFTLDEMLAGEHIWSDRIHEEDEVEVQKNFKWVLQAGGHAINEYRFRKKEGTYIWLRDKLKLIDKEDNGEQIILGSSFDITSRKRAELKLRESKEQYESVVEHIKDVIFQISEDGKWIFLNKAWQGLTGYTPDESHNNVAFSFIHPEDRDMFRNRHFDLVQGNIEVSTDIVRLLRKNKGYVWVKSIQEECWMSFLMGIRLFRGRLRTSRKSLSDKEK